jgi:hypothetical protein
LGAGYGEQKMLKNRRLLLLPVLPAGLAVMVLAMRLGYPWHRWIAFGLLMSGWIPIVVSYRQNRRLMQLGKLKLKKKVGPYRPHLIVAFLLALCFYVIWVLFPAENSALSKMTPEQLREEIEGDLGSYLMLRKSMDDIVGAFLANDLLSRPVETLTEENRQRIRALWRDGVMAFLEFDLLKEKYKGFYQRDYIAEPDLHSDAFFLAYASYIAQYNACLEVYRMVDDNEFMETLLNEAGEGIPARSFLTMKKRLTHPRVTLRLNAGTVYYELVKDDITLDRAVVDDFEKRRATFFGMLSENPTLYLENPLDLLERFAFDSWFPLQRRVAVQMSYIRTAKRNYLITPEIVSRYRDRFAPGDIMLQRRNWHMTNIGIPGFWPHTALYIGTPEEVKSYFEELGLDALATLKALYPDAYEAWSRNDEEGYAHAVIEAIRPGVVFQSLEQSAHCDYLAVVRPRLSKANLFKGLMNAFSHYGKPYDLNFDFATDNELVCSELVYKAYRPLGVLPFETTVVSGRLLLPPNRMAEQIITDLRREQSMFDCVLFLDAVEKSDEIREGSVEAFCETWASPKWDILQK